MIYSADKVGVACLQCKWEWSQIKIAILVKSHTVTVKAMQLVSSPDNTLYVSSRDDLPRFLGPVEPLLQHENMW